MARNILKLAGITASVLIGAGFATGCEIKNYFTRYGAWGCLLIGLSAVLLFAGCLRLLVGDKRLCRPLTAAYVFFCYVLMLAALGELTAAHTDLPAHAGILSGALLSLLGVFAGFGRFTGISGVLSPAAALVMTGLLLFVTRGLPASPPAMSGSVGPLRPGTALFLYCGYNFLSAMVVLPEVGAGHTRKEKILGCGLGMAGVFTCVFLINRVFLLFPSLALSVDMPTLLLIFRRGSAVQGTLALSLLTLTMLLSVCGSAVGFARMAAPGRQEKKMGIFLIAAGTPPAFFGFGNLMNGVYPLFGGAGALLLLFYLTGYFKKAILYRKEKMRSGNGGSGRKKQKTRIDRGRDHLVRGDSGARFIFYGSL